MVKANPGGGSLTINYNKIIANVHAQRIPSQNKQASEKVYMEISLKGENSGDKMWLFNQPGTTRRFDNGWDGTKIMGAAGTPQLFAMEESGNYQISTSDDINNTFLGFQAGNDVQDTLTFTNENIESKYTSVYLVDLVENKVTDITKSGTQYTFTAESTPQAIKRFKIVTRLDEKDAPDASTQIKVFNSGNTVFVQNLGDLNGVMFIYDMMGRTMKNTSFGPYGITAVQVGTITGAYVVKAATSNESVSKRVIIGKE